MAEPPSPTPTSAPTGSSWWAPTSRTTSPSTSPGGPLWPRRAPRRGRRRGADADVRRPRRDRRAQRRAHGHAGSDRRAVVPARRRRAPQPGVPVLLGDVVVCPAVAADQAPTTPARSTTSWPCSSCTACSTSSATTTPSRRRDGSDARPRARPARAPPLGRTGAGRLPPARVTKAHLMREPAATVILIAIVVLRPAAVRAGDRRDRRSTGSARTRPRRSPTTTPSVAGRCCGSSRSRSGSSTRCW